MAQYGRFMHQGQATYGMVEEETVYTVEGSIFEDLRSGDCIGRLQDLPLLVPCAPGKVVAIGPNYRHPGAVFPDREPQLFFKPNTSLIASGDAIELPWMSGDVIYEPELAVVIGRKAKNVSVETALEAVFGYTCANDVTAKDCFANDRVMAGRSKVFDTFCPLGPLIVGGLDGNRLRVSARVNGHLKVEGHTSQMVWSVEEVVSFISCITTLLPGDVILMAAPGIGPLVPGDLVEVEIEGIGTLSNPVVQSPEEPVAWQKER